MQTAPRRTHRLSLNAQGRSRRPYPVLELTPGNALCALGMVAATALSVAASAALGDVVDAVAASASLEAALPRLGAFLGVSLAAFAANLVLTQLLPARPYLRASVGASRGAIGSVLAAPQRVFARHDEGHYLNFASMVSLTYGDVYLTVSVLVVGGVACTALLVACAAAISPWIGALLAASVPVYLLAVDRPTAAAMRYQTQYLPRQDAWLGEGKRIAENRRAIAAERAQGHFAGRFGRATQEWLGFMRPFQSASSVAGALPAALSLALQAVSLAAAAALFAAGRIELGQIAVAWQLGALLQTPMGYVSMVKSYYQANRPSVDALRELDRSAAEPSGFEALLVERGVLVRTEGGSLYATPDRAADHLLFSTGPLTIPKGTLTVLKGANGSGKSMLLDYLCGLSDVDDFDGRMELDASLARCAYLTYPVVVVTGSLEDNMFGVPADPEVMATLGAGALAEKDIDGDVVNLSLGERQKLGLLRALSAHAETLLLDEPLTNLDQASAARLCAYVARVRDEGTSVICIMHSRDLDDAADLVLEIRDHRLVTTRGGGRRA